MSPLFVKRDLDGFFGLFIDNLVQLLVILAIGQYYGLGGEEGTRLLVHIVLPGAAVSIVFGNLLYAWQARRLARREQRSDVTALPYGINTPSLFIYYQFVILPEYQRTGSVHAAWLMGVFACLGSALIEFGGAFVAEQIRRRTPRAALLSTLAGIAIGFIAMDFVLQIYNRPLVALAPLAIILITYFSRIAWPAGIPGGLVAVVLGTLCAWTLPSVLPAYISGPAMNWESVRQAWDARQWCWPQFVGAELWDVLMRPDAWRGYLAVILPMGLFNVIGSLQNIESAEAAGDRYDTRFSLAVNGLGSLLAALFGSCFPTTIYIGHPGWKGLGARSGYSTLNGVAIAALCFTGTIGLVSSLVPLEAGVSIVLWIGIVITAQAFSATAREHAPAVAIGLFPAIAAWGANLARGAFVLAGGLTLQKLLESQPDARANGYLLHGLCAVDQGYIVTCLVLSALTACLIDRKFTAGAVWCGVAALSAFIGLTHAYQLSGNTIDFLFVGQPPLPETRAFRADGIALGYLLCGAVCLACGAYHRAFPTAETAAHD